MATNRSAMRTCGSTVRSLYFTGVWFGCNSDRESKRSVLVEIAI